MKPTFFILFIFLFSVLISCKQDMPEKPFKAQKLKRKLVYRTPQDTIPLNIFDYEYDTKNRLEKIQSQGYFEVFKYDSQDQLIGRSGYQIGGSASTLSDSIFYKYKNGQLVSEELRYLPPAHSLSSHQTIYEYENSKLIKMKEYQDQQFWRMTRYEYSGNQCTRENQYNDSIGTDLFRYWTHLYDKDKVSISSQISVQGGVYNEMPLLVIYYFYDENGNLIIESAEQSMMISAWIGYFNRYEYY